MTQLDKVFDAKQYEDDIYKMWEESGVFGAQVDPSKKPFVISMPPPNATGTLHLGHATMLAIEDVLIRYKRMQGFNALWIPGTDHAAIATQNKVEAVIEEEGLNRHDLGREKFLERVKAFVADSQDTIRNQVRKMGSSCDWSREAYTFSDELSFAVNTVFKKMYEDGLVYRGNRIVNWCCRCQSTLSDDEVSYKEEKTKFYYIKYGPVIIGTARPETKFADKVIIIHPDDERYKDYIGKEVELDWIDGRITAKFVADNVADMSLGSGAMTITPAHSFVDFELAQKYGFEILSIIGMDGKMLSPAGEFEGMDVMECREKLVKKMQSKKLIESIDENYVHNLSLCYRCGTAIQPLVSEQWFVNVNKKLPKEQWEKKENNLLKDLEGTEFSIKEVANHVVRVSQIKIIPNKFNKTYFRWMENLRDWCVSRQIWWGHRIPVFYCNSCSHIMVELEEMTVCDKCGSPDIRQDEDTLDTWFSSALWTFSTLGWPNEMEDMKYFHPTQVMETGYDILFFWVARMIIMSTYVLGEIPFETVYLHGLVRDKEGRKMSKSFGNGIDPLDMIEKFGTDPVRLSLILGTTPGNDMRLYEEKIAGYRNFVNKLWNAARFSFMMMGDSTDIGIDLSIADKWILTRTQSLIEEVTALLDEYKLSEAGNKIYEFTWGAFCDWYLEISKVQPNPTILKYVLEIILKLSHPFTPFVTEAIYGQMHFLNKESYKMLICEPWPPVQDDFVFEKATYEMEVVIDVIKAMRSLRSESKVDSVRKITAFVYGNQFTSALQKNAEVIKRMANLSEFTIAEAGQKIEKSITAFVGEIEIYLPIHDMVDMMQEKQRLQKEYSNLKNYSDKLEQKLANEQFVKHAPEHIIEIEKQKLKQSKLELAKIEQQMNEI